MEDAFNRLTKNGAFDNPVLVLTQQKPYSDGPVAQNDVLLFVPPTVLHHCIFHHNSNGLFIEIVDIGLFKYQEVTNADDESINEDSLSDTNMNQVNESEWEDVTGGIKDTDYEENWRFNRGDKSFNSEDFIEIKEEHIFEEDSQEVPSDEIVSSMQIKIEEEYLDPLLPLNSIGETLTDPNTNMQISRDPETYIVSNKQSKISAGMSRKQNISKSPRVLSKQLNISSNENSFHSQNIGEHFLSKCNKPEIETVQLPTRRKPESSKQKTMKRKSGRRPFNSRKKKVFSCSFCHKNLSSKKSLSIHEKTHTLEKPYSCEKCGKIFATNSTLQKHLVTHTNDRLFSCGICKKTFKSKLALTFHMKIHSQLKPQTCEICNKNLANKITLANHMKMQHTSREKFKCPHCDKSYTRSSRLTAHVREIHTRAQHVKKYTCNECQEMFPIKLELKRHLRSHFPKKRNICTECGYVAPRPSQLLDHRRTHTGERPFVCQVCKKAFRYRRGLRAHMRSHVTKISQQVKVDETPEDPAPEETKHSFRVWIRDPETGAYYESFSGFEQKSFSGNSGNLS